MDGSDDTRRARTAVPAWAGYLATGAAIIIGYRIGWPAGFGQPVAGVVLYCGVSLSAAVALALGTARQPARDRFPWLLLTASQVVYVVADIAFYVRRDVLGLIEFPSFSDIGYSLHYVLLLAALYRLVRRPAQGRDLPTVIDTAIVAVATGLLMWVFVLTPALATSTGLSGRLGALYYPLLDASVLALGVRLSLGRTPQNPALALLVGALAVNMLTNSIYGIQQAQGTYTSHNAVDFGWFGYYLLIGACALHPSAARLSRSPAVRGGHLDRWRVALLAVAAMTAPVVLLAEGHRGTELDHTVAAVASALLILLVLARLSGVLAEARTAAVTDELTGLPNRALFVEHVRAAMAQSRRQGTHTAVLFLDLDRFKLVNDALGHAAGDRLIVELARRLAACLREGDVAARHGGDEFTVLLTGLADPDDAERVAERIRIALSHPVVLDGQRLDVSVSVGVTTQTDDADGPDDLLRYADSALYRAKDDGRNRVRTFDRDTRDALRRRVSEEAELRDALAAGEITAWFQPLVDLRTGDIVGAEVLARWLHPTDGVRLPGRFFPVATEAGLRSAISRVAGVRGHDLLDALGDDVPAGFRLAVNLDVAELSLAEVVDRAMRLTEGRPDLRQRITLEVTETAIIKDAERAARGLDLARAHGFAVALDDFGTGYSSLSLLRDLPLDVVKIDRSFVPRATARSVDSAIVEAIVALARRLGLEVVAEGVETEEQARRLLSLGVTKAQGFHYSPAVPLDQILGWLRGDAPWQAERPVTGVTG